MKSKGRIPEILFLVFMLFLCGVIIASGTGKLPYIFGYRVLKVISSSMQPTIQDGTCIVIQKVDTKDIQVGDIITFVSDAPDIEGYLNTHRVSNIIRDGESGELLYITKGDAYEVEDDYSVEASQIVGRYVGALPFGNVIYQLTMFLSNRTNYFVVIMIPLLLCCLSYIRQLWKALSQKKKDM